MHEVLNQLLETAIEAGWTVLRGVLTNLGTELVEFVLRRLTRQQASSKEMPPDLEIEDQFTHEQPVSSDQQFAWWVPIMQEQTVTPGGYSQNMLDEVDIVSLAAKECPVLSSIRDIQDLDTSDDAIDVESGLVEVKFKDLPTDVCFDGYIIEANPAAPDHKGVDGYKSPSVIARPAVIGATVTEILRLHPGTKYHVTVFAVVGSTIQISPNQHNNDGNSVTTLLSAPFLNTHNANSNEPTCESSQADMGSGADGCSQSFPNCRDGTHFQFLVSDDNGRIVDYKLVDNSDGYLEITRRFFQSVFAEQQGDLTLSVSQGCMNHNKYTAMSDTVRVVLKSP